MMESTIRTTSTGRTIIESAGYCSYYGGFISGEVAYRISLPLSVTVHTRDSGETILRHNRLNYTPGAMAVCVYYGYIKGARVYEYRKIRPDECGAVCPCDFIHD